MMLDLNFDDTRIKRIFDSIDPKIAKANPLISHFALDPENKNHADVQIG